MTDASQVTLGWLNRVLSRGGAIETGEVSRFRIAAGEGTWSTNARLRLNYSAGSIGRKPESLFLKMCPAVGSEFILESEVEYYTRDYVGCEDAPLVPCYDARYSPALGAYHILLDDLTETHQTNWHLAPTLEYGLTLADAIATLHAYRWGEGRWAGTTAAIPEPVTLQHFIDHISLGFEPLLEDIRGDVPSDWETTLREIFRSHPRLMAERTRYPKGFTLVHGDINPGNVLSPNTLEGRLRIIDRQPFDWSLTTWLAASDLAYMIVPWWDEAVRRDLEMPALAEYHAALVRRGVTDYGWEDLLADYRLCVIEAAYTAVEWCGTEDGLQNKKWIWFPKLQRAMAAFDDWSCSELLD